MKQMLLLLFFLVLLTSCFNSSKPAPQQATLENFRLKNSIGDTLCYKRVFIDLTPDLDTLKAFSIWIITKDTLIDGDTLLVYEGTEYQESAEKIDTVPRRSLVKQDESGVSITDFNLGFLGKELSGGPLRSTKDLQKLRFNQIRATLLERAGIPSLRIVDSTDIFEDHIYVLSYPLYEGLRWWSRDLDNKWGHGAITKLCHGFDTIQHQGIAVPTVKTEFLTGEDIGIDDIFLYQWYDSLGIIKSVIDYGEMFFDSGEILNAREYYTRIPYSEVDLSTLKPYLKN